MARKSKIQRELEKKQARRSEEIRLLADYQMKLHEPVAPKKPEEFKFDKDDVESFGYVTGIGNTILEKKSDGFCVHVSVDRRNKHEKVRVFSSGSNAFNVEAFPEVTRELIKLPSGYYHGELLGLKPEGVSRFTSLDEFTAVQKRLKSNINGSIDEIIRKYPLKLDIFDVLMIENENVLAKTMEDRREILEEKISESKHIKLIQQWRTTDEYHTQKLFLQAIENNYEGLIAKDPESLYVPGSRNSDWIKLKEFTTLDLAILGFYETPESKRAGKPFASLLCCSYNTGTKEFETVVKIKVGSVKDQKEIYSKLRGKIVATDGTFNGLGNFGVGFNPEIAKSSKKIPDRMVRYNSDDIAIVEVKALDVTYSENWHSCGLEYDGNKAHSLRIASYVQLRHDKTRKQDVTTTRQMHDFHDC